MKRTYDDSKVEECSFADLLPNTKQLVIVYAHDEVSLISTVCKEWRDLIDKYEGWLEIARRNYNKKLIKNERASMDISFKASFIIERLFDRAEKDSRAASFANYIGRLLNSKLRRLLQLKDNTEEEFYHNPYAYQLLTCLFIYVRTHLCNILTLRNYNKRDVYLNFREVDHLYILIVPGEDGKPVVYKTVKPDDNGDKPTEIEEAAGWTSMTGFIHTLFPPFPRDEVIRNMMAEPTWGDPVKNAYYGMTHEEIVAQWEMIAETASKCGTAMHLNLERYHSEQPYKTDSKEFKFFKAYEAKEITGKYEPYRTEWTIYDRQTKLCGSIDMLWKPIVPIDHGDGKLHLKMTDWKRCRRIKDYNMYSSGCVPCTQHLGDCNSSHFHIQLPGYKEILEKEENGYNIVIENMDLGVFHPNQQDYLCVPIKWDLFKPIFRGIMDYRLQHVS